MPDDNSKNQDDHWRRLAEELGLPFDEPAPAPVREPSPPVPVREPSPPAEPVAAKMPVAEPIDFLEDEEEAVAVSPSALSPAPGLESGEAEAKNRVRLEPVAPNAAGDEEGKPRRGRRRRGRGRGERRPGADDAAVRPGSSDEPAPAVAEELTDVDIPQAEPPEEGAESEAGDQQGPRKRRRRRRRRKPDEAGVSAGAETPLPAGKPAPIQAVAEEFDEEEDENEMEDVVENGKPQGGMDADDDEPEEDFSDWNVPSWNDLIASLYRPDR
jgi:hypothetical protein